MILATALVASLAGCSAPKQPQRPVNFDNLLEGQQVIERVLPQAPYGGRYSADITRPASHIQSAMQAKMELRPEYEGKTCDLRIKFNRNAQVESVKNMGGDPALCHAAMLAVSKTNFPQFENEGVYQALKDATFSFRF